MNGLNPKIFRQSCTFEVRLSNCFLTLEPLEVEMVTEEDYVLGHELATGLVQHIYNLSVWGGGPQTITVWIPKVSVAGLALTPSPSPPVSSLWLKDASEQRKMPGGGLLREQYPPKWPPWGVHWSASFKHKDVLCSNTILPFTWANPTLLLKHRNEIMCSYNTVVGL